MSLRLNNNQKRRIAEVIKSKIRKLREAPVNPNDEEDEFEPGSVDAPAQKPEPDVTPSGEDGFDATDPAKAAPRPTPSPAKPEAPTDPTMKAPGAPAAPAEPDAPEAPAKPEAPADDASPESKIRQAKVRLFFDKLGASPALMGYLNFTSPLEQAEAIQQFAELVRVPRSQLLPLLNQIRTLSQAQPTSESTRRKKSFRR